MSPPIESSERFEFDQALAERRDSVPLKELGVRDSPSLPIRILLVEDNIETATMIRHLLVRDGYEVVQLDSGQRALELIAAVERGDEPAFDVALLDIMMPYVNGYEVCQEIRRTKRLGYIPIIMVTALDRTEDMVRGLDLGADDYLIKPFNPRELLARVRAALRVRDVDRTMRRRNWQLTVLNALNDAIGGSLDSRQILQAALDLLLKHLELSYAVVFLLDQQLGELTWLLYHDGTRWSEEQIADADKVEIWQSRDAYQLALDVIESRRFRLQTRGHGWPTPAGRRDWRVYVPLKTRLHASPRVLGALLVGASAEQPIVELELLTAIGNQIGQALEKAHYYQETQDRGEELTVLYKLAQTVASILDVDAILTAAMESICQIVPVQAGGLLLLRDSPESKSEQKRRERRLKFVRTIREQDAFLTSREIDPEAGALGRVIRQGRPLIVKDAGAAPDFPSPFDRMTGFVTRSALYVPLLLGDHVIGVIELLNKVEPPFDKRDLELVSSMAASIAVAIEKSRLFRDLAVAYDDLETSRQTILASRNRLQALFDSISDVIYVVDSEYRIAAVNAALSQWLSDQPQPKTVEQDEPKAAARVTRPQQRPRDWMFDAQEKDDTVVGRVCYQTLFGREHPCEGCKMVQALQTGERVQWPLHGRRPNGGRREWEMSAYAIQGWQAGTSLAIVLARDVTEQRMLEASLSQSEKLASLGQLAAGLAHEINNPLTAIVANVQLLLLDAQPDDDDYESLDLIKQASDRAVRVVRNLLDFSRQEQYEFQSTDLNATLRGALGLVRHQFLMAHVKVVEELAPDLPPALVSRDHLQGVWLNLLLNARDAVTQDPDQVDGRRVWVTSRLREDGLIEVTIRDNGVGIPPPQLNRIFEPFFTTKDPGKGTGLGLSTSYHIVKQHGGEIQVESEVGVETTFTVLLPTAAQSVDEG